MNRDEFDDLLDAYLLQEASSEQCARLQDLLRAEPAARRRFVEVALVETRLHGTERPAMHAAAHPALSSPTTMPVHKIFQRGIARLRRLDFATVAVVGVVAITMFFIMRPNSAPPNAAFSSVAPIEGEGRAIEPEQKISTVPVEGGARTVEGLIQSIDAKERTFVLGGLSESRTTFKIPIASEGTREPAQLLLDGIPATFEDAIQPQRKAVVMFAQVADEEPWVWKVHVVSTTK